ncbi:MAG: hypothetical protein K2P81_02810 [Bacteriovoracaceae bacterium]|nr:hypothetical protein [Bacteriovoracaceae bacterium]
MENILLTLVVVLLVLLLILLGGLFVLGFELLRKKDLNTLTEATSIEIDDRLHPDVRKKIEEARFIQKQRHIEATCQNHENEPSEGACAICDKYFCKSCLKSNQNLWFCREHVSLFLNFEWGEVFSVKSTANDPEAGVAVVDWKKQEWETNGTPLYIQTHYKINVDGDQIESWVVLFAREEEREEVRKKLGHLSDPISHI